MQIVAVMAKGMDEGKVSISEDFMPHVERALESANGPMTALIKEVGAIPLDDDLGTVAMV